MSVFSKRHWRALRNMMFTYKNFPSAFMRYFFGVGGYPHTIKLKYKGCKSKTINITLYSHDDILTVNEIFCRKDYNANNNIKNIVDIGSNIGISALYFLTRNNYSRCYLFEPVPQNILRLKDNLKSFEDRYELNEIAVSDKTMPVEFGIEETGRYGGIGVKTNKTIEVECRHINSVLSEVFQKCNFIDILKIDTEGVEIQTVLTISSEYLNKIGKIYIEACPNKPLLSKNDFTQVQRGGICYLYNKSHKKQ